MNDYKVVSLRGNEQLDLNGVRFDGKNFLFWKKKSTQIIKQVVIIFNKKYENMEIRDGMMILSLKGLTSYQDLYRAISIFIQILRSNQRDIKFHFIVENENQREMAEELGRNLGISYEINNLLEANKEANKKVNAVLEKLNNNQNVKASGSKTIEVQKDTGIEKVTINNDKAYVNNGMLSIEEQKYLLLQEWKKDSFMSSRLENMTPEEIDRMLTEKVTRNLTTYRMESAREQSANNEVGEVAMNKATNEDGLVNAELGLVENNVYNPNKYSAVEQRGENVQVVNASVTASQINSGGITESSVGNGDSQEHVTPSLGKKEEQPREVISQFYLDDEYNVYDNNGSVLGKIGQDGYIINYDDNTLVKDGQTVGYIGDYNDMGKVNSNTYSKPYTKVKKPEPNFNKSNGFVSLPVIIFVISALLLIGSVILLFVLD